MWQHGFNSQSMQSESFEVCTLVTSMLNTSQLHLCGC